ncbi:MAG TPA: hypothetical protein VGR03_09415, partial [Candidatus Acidoferrum sp.]|nr:hypothetical protein [Candidatus Acidoferrum sp.]
YAPGGRVSEVDRSGGGQTSGHAGRVEQNLHTGGTAGWSACGVLGVTGGRRSWPGLRSAVT